jgi:hypothetical protein
MNHRFATLKASLLLLPLMLLSCFNVATANETNNPKPSINRAEEEARVNLKYLLGNVLQKSKALQETYGDFSPYGAALFESGAIKYVWYAKPGQVVTNPAKSLPLIWQTLQTQAASGKIVGSAVIYKFNKKGQKYPHVTVELEYQTGLALGFASEMIVDADKKVSWGRNKQLNSTPRIFSSQ